MSSCFSLGAPPTKKDIASCSSVPCGSQHGHSTDSMPGVVGTWQNPYPQMSFLPWMSWLHTWKYSFGQPVIPCFSDSMEEDKEAVS